VAAVAILAVALTAAGYAIAVAHTWASCRSFKAKSYPHAYPQCQGSRETARPKVFAAAGGITLVLVVGGVYLLTTEEIPPRRR
jgi:hypothetical protein